MRQENTTTALDPVLTVIIGWDRPLNTHFAIVIDGRKAAGRSLL
jgi:hypothetical protein